MVPPMDLDAFYEKYEESWADMVEEEWDDREDDEQRQLAIAEAAERAAERAKNPRPTTPPPPVHSSFRQEKPVELDSVSSWRRDENAPPKLVAIDAMNHTPKVTAWTNTIERLSRHATPLTQQRIEKKVLPEKTKAEEVNASSSWHAYSRVLQQEYKDERAAAQEDFVRRFRAEVQEDAKKGKQAKEDGEIASPPPDTDATSRAEEDLPSSHASLAQETAEEIKEDLETERTLDQGRHVAPDLSPSQAGDSELSVPSVSSKEQLEEPDERVIEEVISRDVVGGEVIETIATHVELSSQALHGEQEASTEEVHVEDARSPETSAEETIIMKAPAMETPAMETPIADSSPEQAGLTPASSPLQRKEPETHSSSVPTNSEGQVKPGDPPVSDSKPPTTHPEETRAFKCHNSTQSAGREPSPAPRVETITQVEVSGTPVLKASLSDLLSDAGSPRLPPAPAAASPPILKAALSDMLSDTGSVQTPTRARSPQRAPNPTPPAGEQAGSVNKWAAFASAHKAAAPLVDSGVHMDSRSSCSTASDRITSRSPSREKAIRAASPARSTHANGNGKQPPSESTVRQGYGWGVAAAVDVPASVSTIPAQPSQPTAPVAVDANATLRWKQFATSHKPMPSHSDVASQASSHDGNNARGAEARTGQSWGSKETLDQQQRWGVPSEPATSTIDQGWGSSEASQPAQHDGWGAVGQASGSKEEPAQQQQQQQEWGVSSGSAASTTAQGWGSSEASQPAQQNGWASTGQGVGVSSEVATSTNDWGSREVSQPAANWGSVDKPAQDHGWGSLPAAASPSIQPASVLSGATPKTAPNDDNDGRAAPAWRQKVQEAARYRSRH
ncbi:hypothetical protein BCR43DRAFT_67276 [Syncephalastrum racemosum]|uniref:Uncharacterized protein n=1 Tax=Syncephalastrum racemosum TaxID=13706 RepID=A0A1X2HWS6_SYNRA|nr:hypothetical protein BCR43DRAFT_67276 [Syncephalastrum racemosum]